MMRKKWNIILIAVLLLLTSVFLSACEEADEGQDASISNEQDDSTEEISDEPIEYDDDYMEDDEMVEDESSEGDVGDHEDDTVIDESDDTEVVPEKESEY